ncbi:MAG: nucleotide exchange factor GrpE [Hyphomicrobiales bacterium]
MVEVMQAGYTIGDRVLRPALVAVSKGRPKPAPQAKADQGGNGFGDSGKPANDDIPTGGD